MTQNLDGFDLAQPGCARHRGAMEAMANLLCILKDSLLRKDLILGKEQEDIQGIISSGDFYEGTKTHRVV